MKLFKRSQKAALQQGLDRDREQAGHGATEGECVQQTVNCGCGHKPLFQQRRQPGSLFQPGVARPVRSDELAP